MGTRFNQCPNCGHEPSGFGVSHMDIFECKKCGTHYCHDCGGDRCPDCASQSRGKAGKVYK